MDKILIKDLSIFAFHGVNPPEKENGQKFILDITLYTDLSVPCKSDNVRDTVSYSDVIRKVTEVFTAEKYDLIERAADEVASTVLDEFPSVCECQVLLKKPEAPIKADFSYVAVEIRRKRNV